MAFLPPTFAEDVIDQPARVQLEVFLDEHRMALDADAGGYRWGARTGIGAAWRCRAGACRLPMTRRGATLVR